MRLSKFVIAPMVVLLVAGIAAGLLTGAFSAGARKGLYATGLLHDGGASTVPPGTFSNPSPSAPPPERTPEPQPKNAPAEVLAVAKPGPSPQAARVAAKVAAVDRAGLKGTFSGSVVDVGTGRRLYGKNATVGYIPASTLKLLTTTAALSILGPQHEFATTVVSPAKGRVVLVGGGDPYLMKTRLATDPDRATLARLAQLTAAQLAKTHTTKVQLGYDASLFSGPAWHPDWPAMYHDQVTPISALWVNEGRIGGQVGPRVSNPAKSAAEAFAAALKARGVTVTKVAPEKAAKGATQLAVVRSLPLERIVNHLLMVSDNDAAEVLARQAAIGAGQPGSFVAARSVVRARLTKLGVWDDTAKIRDGSGLSRRNLVPSDMMAQVLRLDLQPAHPELRAVVGGLPVAGVEGSLRVRFGEKDAVAGRGLVRAKTGTLTQVSALAGFVRTADGSMLAYAFLANGATDYFGTRAWLDRVTTAVSTCGCG